jgi:hypothetical protein
MTERSEGLRLTAAHCLALAQTTTDPSTRAGLVTMARQLHDLADRGSSDIKPRLEIDQDRIPVSHPLAATSR